MTRVARRLGIAARILVAVVCGLVVGVAVWRLIDAHHTLAGAALIPALAAVYILGVVNGEEHR